MSEAAAYLKFFPLPNSKTKERIAALIINRPASANSFNGALLDKLSDLIEEVAKDPTCRLLLLQGAGKHFSAGADLTWMKEAAKLDYNGNKLEAEKLRRMFEALNNLTIPTIAVVNGAAFGGGVGLIAACDYAIAVDTAKICLSEVKIGLVPAVIMPYLARKMHRGHLNRLAMTGKVFNAAEAKEAGLVQIVTNAENLQHVLLEEINLLLQASPDAQKVYKNLEKIMRDTNAKQTDATVEAIANIRASASGQAGLQAFFDQKPAPWLDSFTKETNVLP